MIKEKERGPQMTEIRVRRPRGKDPFSVGAAGAPRDRVDMCALWPQLSLACHLNASNQPVDHSSLTACSTTHLLVTHRVHRGPPHRLFPPLYQDCTKCHRGLARGMVPERVCNVSLSLWLCSASRLLYSRSESAVSPSPRFSSSPTLTHFPDLWCFWRGGSA